MAVDLGFEGRRWLTANGTVVENETSWLHQLDPSQVLVAEALKFWDALRAVGTSAEVGMFAGPVADRPHLQNWSDAGVDMASRLADLLTRSGTMRWAGQQQRYRCDLGLRGELFPVGNASQVWNRQATVTVDMLMRARAASAAAAPGAQHFRNAVQPGASTLRAGAPHPAAPSTPAITQADITAKRQELRRQFELADANWRNWTAH